MREIYIGAPCNCGVAQAFHGGLTCEQAVAAKRAPLKAMLRKAFKQLREQSGDTSVRRSDEPVQNVQLLGRREP